MRKKTSPQTFQKVLKTSVVPTITQNKVSHLSKTQLINVQSNEIARYGLDISAQFQWNIFLIANHFYNKHLDKVDTYNEKGLDGEEKVDEKGKPVVKFCRTITFSAKDIPYYKIKKSSQWISEQLEQISNINLVVYGTDGRKYETTIFTGRGYDPSLKQFTLKLNADLVPHFQNLTGGFTSYSLKEALSIPSIYGKPLYLALCSYAFQGKWSVSIDELVSIVNFKDEKRKIINRSIAPLHEFLKKDKGKLSFEYSVSKKGNKIDKILFFDIKNKAQRVKNGNIIDAKNKRELFEDFFLRDYFEYTDRTIWKDVCRRLEFSRYDKERKIVWGKIPVNTADETMEVLRANWSIMGEILKKYFPNDDFRVERYFND